MNARSLKLRLLIAAAVAVFAALAASWLAMGYLFERHVERRAADDLTARGRAVAAALVVGPDGALRVDAALGDPRFEAPASGFYWQVRGEDALLRSRSLWDEALPPAHFASAEAWARGGLDGPFGQRVIAVARSVRLEPNAAALEIIVAENHADITAATAEFSRELAIYLALLWVVLAAAAWAQVTLGLKPLEDVRAALGGLARLPSARLSESAYPTEAAPLAHAINALADAREQDLEEARRRAGDLAHSLKTPLAALAAQSRRAREAGASEAADGLDRAIEAARRTIERELARARAAAGGPAQADGRAAVAKLILVIEHTAAGGRVTFENAVGETPYPLSADVLMEIAGPLLENAARFARTQVRVSGDGRELAIEDDGPGLSEADAELALARGRRLDESGDGHGLGLAIANDLAQATGGMLTLSRAELGGLRAAVRWT